MQSRQQGLHWGREAEASARTWARRALRTTALPPSPWHTVAAVARHRVQGAGFPEKLRRVYYPKWFVLEKNKIVRPFPEMSESSGRCRCRFKSLDIDFFLKLIKIQEK